MIGFCVDANSNIGMGHLMRCLCIANELKERNIEFFFIISDDSDSYILDQHSYLYFRMTRHGKKGWDSSEIDACILKNGCDCLLVDTYRITEKDILTIKEHVKVAYIDDLYLFDCPADIVINHNIEASLEQYYQTKYENRKIYVGVEYFPLRKEFIKEQNKLLRKKVKEVFITTGSTDPYHISFKLLEILSIIYNEINFNVMIGLFYDKEYKNKIKKLSLKRNNIKLISWGQNMAKIYRNNDVVIAPGSTTIYEALSMGVPCISFEFVDNHHMQCLAMAEMNIVPYIDILSEIDPEKEKRIKGVFNAELNYSVRIKQIENSLKYFDKKGVNRIADILMEN